MSFLESERVVLIFSISTVLSNASAGLYKGIEDIEKGLSTIFSKVMAAKGTIYQINTLGGKINEIANSDSAYPHRDINYLSELQAYWDSPSQEEKLA